MWNMDTGLGESVSISYFTWFPPVEATTFSNCFGDIVPTAFCLVVVQGPKNKVGQNL